MRVRTFKAIRALDGLSHSAFARKIGVSRSLVAQIEHGSKVITDETAGKIRKVYGHEYVAKVERFIEESK
ncbi:helix-turn-helix domain-containing protein [Mesobacillus subterraneus]|uniref:helix-turn-helix transcriptional regulator n=1 Tax=Mesobacillus subterraneus TaxID=285983 RepID=UPI00203C0FA0|nr:helix-turn-helix transcriptional regulator [Mesobacillus subterraneus]MCM3572525.1 helix-turn-helix domain-containing protein [Mesobacillus subterraneus]